jgi:hypothetical protein
MGERLEEKGRGEKSDGTAVKKIQREGAVGALSAAGGSG